MTLNYRYNELEEPPDDFREYVNKQVYGLAGDMGYHLPLIQELIETAPFEATGLTDVVSALQTVNDSIPTDKLEERPSYILGLTVDESFTEYIQHDIQPISPITGISLPDEYSVENVYDFTMVAALAGDGDGFGVYHLSEDISDVTYLLTIPASGDIDDIPIETPPSEWTERTLIEFFDTYVGFLVAGAMGKGGYPIGDGSVATRERMHGLTELILKYAMNAHMAYSRLQKPYTPHIGQ